MGRIGRQAEEAETGYQDGDGCKDIEKAACAPVAFVQTVIRLVQEMIFERIFCVVLRPKFLYGTDGIGGALGEPVKPEPSVSCILNIGIKPASTEAA